MSSKKSTTFSSQPGNKGATASKRERSSTITGSKRDSTSTMSAPSETVTAVRRSGTASRREGPSTLPPLRDKATSVTFASENVHVVQGSGATPRREGSSARTCAIPRRNSTSRKNGTSTPKTVHVVPGSSRKGHESCGSMVNQRNTMPLKSKGKPTKNIFKSKAEKNTDHFDTDQVTGRILKDLDVFSKPMRLVYKGEDGNLYTDSDTIESISKIEARLQIVGIAGPFRTGKSYLINKLAGKPGFVVGDSTKAVTKGIWVWCRQHPSYSEEEPTVLVLLDTEGLGDIKKGNKHHDQQIMTLVTLLCNVLVYNMMGRFDDDSMSKLSFASQISSWVKFGDDTENEEKLGCVMPELVLVLRDFILKFAKGIDSPKAYFEDCLLADSGVEEYDEPRRCLKKYFPDRECFVLPTPGDDDVMARLDSAKDSELKKTFKKGVRELTGHILSSPPKLMFDSEAKVSSPINGTIFKSLVTHYVDCINKGRIPNIEDAYFIAAKEKNKQIGEKTIKLFIEKLKTSFPLPFYSYEQVQKDVLQLICFELRSCRKKMKMDKDYQIEDDVRREMEQIWDEYKKENSRYLQKTLLCDLEERYKKLSNEGASYKNGGGYEAFKNRMNKLQTEFMKSFKHITKDEVVFAWASFSNKMQETEIKVLRNDRNLSNSEKEEQINQLKAENEKVLAKTREKGEMEARRLCEELKLQKEREEHAQNEMKQLRDELNAMKHRPFFGRLKYLLSGK